MEEITPPCRMLRKDFSSVPDPPTSRMWSAPSPLVISRTKKSRPKCQHCRKCKKARRELPLLLPVGGFLVVDRVHTLERLRAGMVSQVLENGLELAVGRRGDDDSCAGEKGKLRRMPSGSAR
jgi:hypothetical protein